MGKLKRYLLITLGSLSIMLGVLGIILPLLPTTPFLLLAAYCYARSSQTLYNKLLRSRWLGHHIENYRSGEGITLKVKVTAVIVLWASSFYSIFYIVPLLTVKLVLLGVISYITYFILTLKTYKSNKEHSTEHQQHSSS